MLPATDPCMTSAAGSGLVEFPGMIAQPQSSDGVVSRLCFAGAGEHAASPAVQGFRVEFQPLLDGLTASPRGFQETNALAGESHHPAGMTYLSDGNPADESAPLARRSNVTKANSEAGRFRSPFLPAPPLKSLSRKPVEGPNFASTFPTRKSVRAKSHPHSNAALSNKTPLDPALESQAAPGNESISLGPNAQVAQPRTEQSGRNVISSPPRMQGIDLSEVSADADSDQSITYPAQDSSRPDESTA